MAGKRDSFDDMSDGVHSDHEARPNIGLQQLNGQNYHQAQKNVFAQENHEERRFAPVVGQDVLDLNQLVNGFTNVKPE